MFFNKKYFGNILIGQNAVLLARQDPSWEFPVFKIFSKDDSKFKYNFKGFGKWRQR